MKILIAVSLYFLGVILYVAWAFYDEGNLEEIKKIFDENPKADMVPRYILLSITFIAVFIISLLWPYFIVSAPIKALKRLKK